MSIISWYDANRSWPKIEGYVLAMPEDEVEAAWRATAAYQTIRHAMNYQVIGSTMSPFRPLSPSEALLPDKARLLDALSARLSGWSEADVDRYVNELLAESEMLKKWAGKLESDESRLLGSLQSLARKDLDTVRHSERRDDKLLGAIGNRMEDGVQRNEDEDVEMTY
jgi:hypothetical protein